jgi:hypothetical protein
MMTWEEKARQLAQMLSDSCNRWCVRAGPPSNPVRPEEYLQDVDEVRHDTSTDSA